MHQNTPSILVVDDDQGILESFDAMLGDEYFLQMFNDGRQALDLLYRHCPQLVFLDLHMPKPDGLELLATIKEMGVEAKVVIVTALAQDTYRETAEKLGAYRYLNKPLDVDMILEIAQTVVH